MATGSFELHVTLADGTGPLPLTRPEHMAVVTGAAEKCRIYRETEPRLISKIWVGEEKYRVSDGRGGVTERGHVVATWDESGG